MPRATRLQKQTDERLVHAACRQRSRTGRVRHHGRRPFPRRLPLTGPVRRQTRRRLAAPASRGSGLGTRGDVAKPHVLVMALHIQDCPPGARAPASAGDGGFQQVKCHRADQRGTSLRHHGAAPYAGDHGRGPGIPGADALVCCEPAFAGCRSQHDCPEPDCSKLLSSSSVSASRRRIAARFRSAWPYAMALSLAQLPWLCRPLISSLNPSLRRFQGPGRARAVTPAIVLQPPSAIASGHLRPPASPTSGSPVPGRPCRPHSGDRGGGDQRHGLRRVLS
jgi:hypothetical protein